MKLNAILIVAIVVAIAGIVFLPSAAPGMALIGGIFGHLMFERWKLATETATK